MTLKYFVVIVIVIVIGIITIAVIVKEFRTVSIKYEGEYVILYNSTIGPDIDYNSFKEHAVEVHADHIKLKGPVQFVVREKMTGPVCLSNTSSTSPIIELPNATTVTLRR